MDNMNRQIELERLRKERIKLEEKAKLEEARQSELGRIQTAKAKTPSKLMAFGQGLAKVMNKGQENAKRTQVEGKGIDFGGHKDIAFGGTKGVDFGSGGHSPFGEVSKPKAVEKKKGDITIHIRR